MVALTTLVFEQKCPKFEYQMDGELFDVNLSEMSSLIFPITPIFLSLLYILCPVVIYPFFQSFLVCY